MAQSLATGKGEQVTFEHLNQTLNRSGCDGDISCRIPEEGLRNGGEVG